MAGIINGIQIEDNGRISFGNYETKEKIKAKAELNGDEYGVKTHDEVTRMEKNGKLLLEAVPGVTITQFKMTEKSVLFFVEGCGDTQITLELLPEHEYKLTIDDIYIGKVKTNRSGKVNFSAEYSSNPLEIRIEKI